MWDHAEERTGPAMHAVFATTHWSVVLSSQQGDAEQVRDALAQLCETYRRPIFAYARSLGFQPSDADDLTQGFFAHLLQTNLTGGVQRRPGSKFRSFLLSCFK